jgi:hypothetical protein
VPFGDDADKFVGLEHDQGPNIAFRHQSEGVEHGSIRMNDVNVVTLLIEHMSYCRHPTSPCQKSDDLAC